MVAVDHEVRLAELDRDDRREAAVRERALERAQSVAAEVVPRFEVARERRRSPFGAHDVVERNGAQPDIAARRTAASAARRRRARAGPCSCVTSSRSIVRRHPRTRPATCRRYSSRFERVVVRTRPRGRRPAHRLVAAEDALEHAFAVRERRGAAVAAPARAPPGRRPRPSHDEPRTSAAPEAPCSRASAGSVAPSASVRELEVEAVDRLADDGAGVLQRAISTSGVSRRKSLARSCPASA